MKVSRMVVALTLAGTLGAPSAFGDQQGRANGNAKAKAAKDYEKDKEKKVKDKDKQDSRLNDDQTPMRFRDMDRDGDRVITRAEWRGNDQSFKQHDSNHDGVLSGIEVRPAVQRPAPDRSRRDEIAARFDRADRNSDGRVVREEWTGNEAAFRRMDRNGDGVVTRDEFSTVLIDRAPGTPAPVERRDATRAYKAGYDRGLVEGRQAGREDKGVNGGTWDLEGQRELEQADSGYNADFGTRADYQSGYRAGFRLGYREGFGPRR